MVSIFFNKGVLIRDIIYGPIAGGIASSSASFWITNPAYAIATGIVSALVQVTVMNLVEKKFAR